MLALVDAGYAVSLPFGENTRYDLIIDDGRTLDRVQCKTGHMRFGAVVFPTASSYAHHPNPKQRRRHYLGQVDSFAVYCPPLSTVYLIPISDLPLDRATLRVTPARNHQRKRIRDAAAYELAKVEIVRPSRVMRDGGV